MNNDRRNIEFIANAEVAEYERQPRNLSTTAAIRPLLDAAKILAMPPAIMYYSPRANQNMERARSGN
jgi:hypothetical protein